MNHTPPSTIEQFNDFKNFIQSNASISDDDFAFAIPHLKLIKLDKGDYFTRPDQVCKNIGFIRLGALRMYYRNDKDMEVTACFCSENHITTSYKSFVLQEPSFIISQAIQETELVVLSFEDLNTLYSQNTNWQKVGRIFAEKEYIKSEKYAASLNNDSAKEKYLKLVTDQPDVLNKAKLEDIASYLGVTRRTLTRIRKELLQSK